MKPLTLLAALISCSVCIGTAEARGHANYHNRKPPVDQFRKLDTNHNGTLSPEEFAAGRKGKSAAEFATLDKNNDGKLDRYEFALMHKKRNH